MALEMRGEERTTRRDPEAGLAGVVQDSPHKRGGNPAAAELRRDLGVERDDAGLDATVVDPAREFVAEPRLVASGLGVVGDRQLGRLLGGAHWLGHRGLMRVAPGPGCRGAGAG